jgi:hypothetical protein
VTNGIPLDCPQPLTVANVNSVQTVKVRLVKQFLNAKHELCHHADDVTLKVRLVKQFVKPKDLDAREWSKSVTDQGLLKVRYLMFGVWRDGGWSDWVFKFCLEKDAGTRPGCGWSNSVSLLGVLFTCTPPSPAAALIFLVSSPPSRPRLLDQTKLS